MFCAASWKWLENNNEEAEDECRLSQDALSCMTFSNGNYKDLTMKDQVQGEISVALDILGR